MELKIYLSQSETSYNIDDALDISPTSTVQMNLTSFNPLTGTEQNTSYSATINCPMTDNNIRLLGGWRYPVLNRRSYKAHVSVGGVMLADKFNVSVSWQGDRFKVQLAYQGTLKNKYGYVYNSYNTVNGQYNEKTSVNIGYQKNAASSIDRILTGVGAIKGIGKDIKSVYMLCLTRQISVGDVKAMTDIVLSADGYGRLTSNKEPIELWLNSCDEDRTIKATTDISYIEIYGGDYPQYSYVTMYINDTAIRCDFEQGADGYAYYRIPYDLPIDVRGGETLRFEFRSPSSSVLTPALVNCDIKFNVIDMTGSSTITYDTIATKKSIYDMLQAYCMINFARLSSGGIIEKMLSNDTIDYTDKVIDVLSISESSNAGNVLTATIGTHKIQAAMSNALMVNSNNGFSAPIELGNELPFIGLIKGDTYLTFYDYFRSIDYNAEYQRFIDNFKSGIEVEVSARLSIFDIVRFDSSKRYYISQLNSYFYVTEISGYNLRTGKCKIKLLKLE